MEAPLKLLWTFQEYNDLDYNQLWQFNALLLRQVDTSQ